MCVFPNRVMQPYNDPGFEIKAKNGMSENKNISKHCIKTVFIRRVFNKIKPK